MKRSLGLIFLAVMCLLPATLPAQGKPVGFSDIQPELETVLAGLSKNVNAFEEIQQTMDASARSNANYNEQKNIFLSSMLAISTIIAICEYERDLMTLFIDLRAKNRVKFYGVRIESLATSARQIENMYRQIQINYTIFPPDIFEAQLTRKERLTIQSSISLLNRCRELLTSVQQP